MADNNVNNIIGIIGTAVFAVLAIIVPFLKILGGFMQKSITFIIDISYDWHWDVFTTSTAGVSVDVAYADLPGGSDFEFIWGILPIWGLAWLGLGLIGAILVLVPPLMKLGNMEPPGAPLGLIGLLAGLIATVVEYGLFLILFLLEDWDATFGITPDLNIILLGCFVIGWVGLIVGYYFPTRE